MVSGRTWSEDVDHFAVVGEIRASIFDVGCADSTSSWSRSRRRVLCVLAVVSSSDRHKGPLRNGLLDCVVRGLTELSAERHRENGTVDMSLFDRIVDRPVNSSQYPRVGARAVTAEDLDADDVCFLGLKNVTLDIELCDLGENTPHHKCYQLQCQSSGFHGLVHRCHLLRG